jgi:hypothetical protein
MTFQGKRFRTRRFRAAEFQGRNDFRVSGLPFQGRRFQGLGVFKL